MSKPTKFLVLAVALLALSSSFALAQDSIILNDGIVNSFFFGGGSNHITMTMPSFNCSGGNCFLATAGATATGDLAGSGTYAITAPALVPVAGGFEGPFSLTVQADGSSIVVQTNPITFTYTSPQGDLTGNMTFTTVSKTTMFNSTMLGTFTATGGSFAPFFPNGAAVSIDLGLPFPLQLFPLTHHAFTAVEFQSGSLIANAVNGCQQTLSRYRGGLPQVFSPDLTAFFTQTNNPSQIPCSPGSPCGSIDVAAGTGSFAGDLVVTVNLAGGLGLQADRMGFSSDVLSGFSLVCFNFDSSCNSGVGGASLGGSMQEDGFGRFPNTLSTGLNGGSGCAPDGTGCKSVFTAVISNSNGPLQESDFNSYVAAHVANGVCTGYIATPRN
jgi:hypothetical protein